MTNQARKTSTTKTTTETNTAQVTETTADNNSNVKPIPVLSAAQSKAYDALTTKSARIRYLDSQQFTRGDIARIMGIRYQHVRNVLITPVKSGN